MKIRKELWFGFVLMALIVAAAIGMLLSVEKVTNGHIGLLMLSLVVVAIMLGFPTAFTLMGMGMLFTWLAYDRDITRTLDLPYAHVYGVATFYTMFRREPAGKNILRICTNISCMLRGGYDVLAAFEKKLGVKKGGTAGQFTIVEEECIAACANAPAIVCGSRYFLDVEPGQVDAILDELKAVPHPAGEVV